MVDNFQTMFLKWRKNCSFYIADDIVNENIKWVLKPSEFIGFRAISVINGVQSTIIEDQPTDPIRLGWQVAVFRLTQIINQKFAMSYLLDEKQIANIDGFLESLNQTQEKTDENGV